MWGGPLRLASLREEGLGHRHPGTTVRGHGDGRCLHVREGGVGRPGAALGFQDREATKIRCCSRPSVELLWPPRLRDGGTGAPGVSRRQASACPRGRARVPARAARPEPPPRGQAHWAPTSDVRVPFTECLASPAPFPPVVPPRAAGDGHHGGRGRVWVWALLLPPASAPRALPAHLSLESFPLVLAYFFWG